MKEKEWIKDTDGVNQKFYRETLLNYAFNRWGLNKAHSVGCTSELIRRCAPKELAQWEDFYFDNAYQKKNDGLKITKEYVTELGKALYIKLTEVVQCELASITEEECIDYAYNLIINRTYEGYHTEIVTIYGQLETVLNTRIYPANDVWDRTYNVDFYIKVGEKSYIGLQIKSIASGKAMNDYQWEKMHQDSHQKFSQEFKGAVFFVYSVRDSKGKKQIYNTEVIQAIEDEITRIKALLTET